MLFNTYSFLFVFLPAVLAIYWRAPNGRPRQWVLFLASYVFYGVWSIKFAGLMLATTSVDYLTARRIEDTDSPNARRGWLALSMTFNLGVLAIFKYYDFFARSLDLLPGAPHLPLLRLALPIGISFYTFESMSYTIDVYRREIRALRTFLDYGHFVTMFPRLVAGPIVRYADLRHELAVIPSSLAPRAASLAVRFFVVGLAKKVLIADVLATRIVDPLFGPERVTHLTAAEAWLAALGYTAQLYYDFSGYSDMAVGLGHAFGLELPRNFNLPYGATNIGEFWRRWHISLSSWLRDYLYIPLGGNRGSAVRTSVNLFLTMLLGGLWHGANWTFIIWGTMHGAALVLYNQVLRGTRLALATPTVIARLATMAVVVGAWVEFRAASAAEASFVYQAMFGAHGLGLAALRAYAAPAVFIFGALALATRIDTYDLVSRPPRRWSALLAACTATLCILRLSAPSPFLYFQF